MEHIAKKRIDNVLEHITRVGKASSHEELDRIIAKLREKPDEEIDFSKYARK